MTYGAEVLQCMESYKLNMITALTALGFLLTFMSNLQQKQHQAALDIIATLVLTGTMVKSSATIES